MVSTQVFAPLFTAIAAKNSTLPSGTDAIKLSLQLARASSKGELPSDELLAEIARFVTPQQLSNLAPDNVEIPSALRDAIETIISPSASALSSAGVLPLFGQVIDTLDQIPLLIEEVSEHTTAQVH